MLAEPCHPRWLLQSDQFLVNKIQFLFLHGICFLHGGRYTVQYIKLHFIYILHGRLLFRH